MSYAASWDTGGRNRALRDALVVVAVTALPGALIPFFGLKLPLLMMGLPIFALGVVHLPTALFITGFALAGFTFLNKMVGFNLARAFGVLFALSWIYWRFLNLRAEPPRLSRRYMPFVFLTCVGALSVFWSEDPGMTVRALPQRIEGVLLGLMLFDCLRDKKRIGSFVGGYVFGGALASGLVVQVYLEVGRYIPQLPGQVHRGTIIGLNPNGLSMNIGVAMFAVIAFIAAGKGLRRRAALFVFPVMVLAVLFMASRGAAIGIAVAMIYLWWSRLKTGDALDLRRLFGWVTVVAVLVIFLAMITDLEQVPMWVRLSRGGSLNEMSSGRAGIWSAAFMSVFEHPFLGSGFGTFSRMYNQYREMSLLTPSVYLDDLTAHNDLLAIVVDMGFFAGFVFMIGVFRYLKSDAGGHRPMMHDCARAAAVVLLVGGMFNAMFDLKEAYAVFGTVAAILMLGWHRPEERAHESGL